MPAEVERDGLSAVHGSQPDSAPAVFAPAVSPPTASHPEGPTLLIVDDSGYARRRLRRFLKSGGWSVVTEAGDGDEALCRYRAERPTLVLIDQVMRGRAGIETASLLLDGDPEARIVMLTAVSDPEVRRRALEAGILQVLRKNDWKGLRDVLETECS